MELFKLALVFLGIIVVVAAVAKILIRAVGAPCQFCENRKLARFTRLSAPQQHSVLSYFRAHEGREPDLSSVFVCLDCKTVHDDFSGEKRSMDMDMISAPVGGVSVSLARTFCKVCNALMQGCDPENEDIHCVRCGTKYRWQNYTETGFRFLMPPRESRILERCEDAAGIA